MAGGTTGSTAPRRALHPQPHLHPNPRLHPRPHPHPRPPHKPAIPGPCAAPSRAASSPKGPQAPRCLRAEPSVCLSIPPSVRPQRNIQKRSGGSRATSVLGTEPPSRARVWKWFACGVMGFHCALARKYCLGRAPAASASKHVFFHGPNLAERVDAAVPCQFVVLFLLDIATALCAVPRYVQ